MLKGQDIVVLAALLSSAGSELTLAELSESVSLGLGPIHRSLGRLRDAGLVTADRQVRLAQTDEFFAHSLRYIFPPRMRGETRGVPTSWAASPLRERLSVSEGLPLVWGRPDGKVRGIELEPIHPIVPEAALHDSALYELLALIDALRSGDARLRNLALSELRERFALISAR